MRFAVESGMDSRALIRPRSGSFRYDADEIAVIVNDISATGDLGLAGVVIGAALENGRLDRDLLLRLADRRGRLGMTLHRVFDLTPDPFESLETAIEIGFDRILTSGQAPTAARGASRIARLVEAARGRITIIAAAGITPDNAAVLLRATSVPEAHASCRVRESGARDARLEDFGFGRHPRETDARAVARLVRVARAFDAGA
jgi:copper homeostasis protein